METKCTPLERPLTQGPRHPLEKSEALYPDREASVHNAVMKNTFGSYLPASLEIEKAMVSKIQRLPPLKSSHLSYEILTGEAYGIDRCNLRNFEQGVLAVDGHRVMEKRLKM
jgi:hypothetical protein